MDKQGIYGIHALSKNKFTEEEIKDFVYLIFYFYDRHVRVDWFRPFLDEQEICMKFPETMVHSFEDFSDWYRGVGERVKWNAHKVEKIDVEFSEGKYQVVLALIWEGEWRDGKPFQYRIDQKWLLKDGEGSWPQIMQYLVLNSQSLLPGDAERNHQVEELFKTGLQTEDPNLSRVNEKESFRNGGDGLREMLENGLASHTLRIQEYIDISLRLREEQRATFKGLPPTILDEHLQPVEDTTDAIDQQRQLYAAALAVLIDPEYGKRVDSVTNQTVLQQLVDWQRAFEEHFVADGSNGPVVRRAVVFSNNEGTRPVQGEPSPLANLRFTYALEGSAKLVEALEAAAINSDQDGERHEYLEEAARIRELVLSIGGRFYQDYADPDRRGRYFIYEHGEVNEEVRSGIEGRVKERIAKDRGLAPEQVPQDEVKREVESVIDSLRHLSHNNAQSYLIKGMQALEAIDPCGSWGELYQELLEFIETQTDEQSGFLHEFDFSDGRGFDERVVGATEFSWQLQEGCETVIFGHTIAGKYEARAGSIVRSKADQSQKQAEMATLLKDFTNLVKHAGGVDGTTGLPPNAVRLDPEAKNGLVPMGWNRAPWQAELMWQFLSHAVEAGMDLGQYRVQIAPTPPVEPGSPAGEQTIALDRLLARGLEHSPLMFADGIYITEYNPKESGLHSGRQRAAPINHAAETIDALNRALKAL